MAKKAPRRKTAGKARPATPKKAAKKKTTKKSTKKALPIDIRKGEEYKANLIEVIETHAVNFAEAVTEGGVLSRADSMMKVGCVFGFGSLGSFLLGIESDEEAERFTQYVMEVFLQGLGKDVDPRITELARAFTEPDEEVREQILMEAGYRGRTHTEE